MCDVKCVPSIASDHNLIRAKVKWVLKNNKMVKGRKRKVLSCLKNSECAIAFTDYVITDYAANRSQNNQHNYSLFSKLTKEAVSKFLPDKDPYQTRKPWEDADITKARESLQQAKFKYFHS